MARVLDPNQDDASYEQFRNLVGITGITSTNAEIDASPLFRVAESAVLAAVPDAALPAGRSHTARADIETATVFFGVANHIRGEDSKPSSQNKVIKSEAVGVIRREYAIAASASLSKEDRAAWFEAEARKLLAPLGSTIETEAIATVQIRETF